MEEVWEKVKFWAALQAHVSSVFPNTSPSDIVHNWKAVVLVPYTCSLLI